MKRVLALALIASLLACSPRQSDQNAPGAAGRAFDVLGGALGSASAPASAPAAEPAPGRDEQSQTGAPSAADAPPQSEAKAQAQKPSPEAAIAGAAMLAYTYSYGVEAPAKSVALLMKVDETLCANAGAAHCQVLGASTTSEGQDDVSAQLSLRAAPDWLVPFRARLEGDAAKAGGKISSTNTTSEDLTRSIVDTQAKLRAETTLRDRLQGLLAGRAAKLSDLLDVERELARVQGEIDATQSNLEVMKTRVTMSELTINYASAGAPLTDTTFAPIKRALEKFVGVVAEGVAGIILFVAAILPFAAIAGGLFWLFARGRRRARGPASQVSPPERPASDP